MHRPAVTDKASFSNNLSESDSMSSDFSEKCNTFLFAVLGLEDGGNILLQPEFLSTESPLSTSSERSVCALYLVLPTSRSLNLFWLCAFQNRERTWQSSWAFVISSFQPASFRSRRSLLWDWPSSNEDGSRYWAIHRLSGIFYLPYPGKPCFSSQVPRCQGNLPVDLMRQGVCSMSHLFPLGLRNRPGTLIWKGSLW